MQKVNFDVENFDIVEENSDSQFCTGKILAFSSSKNKHDLVCDEEVLKSTAPTIYNKPILYNINETILDFGSHVPADRSLICGFVVPESAEFVRLPDDRLGLSVICKLWKKYAQKAISILKKDGGQKSVSVEMELYESKDRDDGLKDMLSFSYTGICLLGDLIQAASPSASIQMLSFAEEQKEYMEAFSKEFGKYDDVDFTIPEIVKANAKEGLELRKQHGKGGNPVSLSIARYINSHDTISPDKIRIISKYFERHKNDDLEDKSSASWISWQLLGGNKEWSDGIFSKMNKKDDERVAYFAEEITMPYKNIADVNPALKGIDPPITVGQANEIAKQADAIGVDEKKNGWAIAISAFRKSHTVKDGKWVKKENMEENLSLIGEKEEMSVDENKVEEKKEEEKDEKMEAEEKEETKEEEKKEEEGEKKEEKMSNDSYLDVAAVLAMLEDETDDYKSLVEAEFAKEEGINYGLISKNLFAKMCKMSEKFKTMSDEKEKFEAEAKAYMAKNAELEKFKSDYEKEQKQFAIDSTFALVKEEADIPEEKINELMENAKNFSLETIDGWKNLVKSVAFDFKKPSDKKESTNRMGMVWPITPTKNESGWGKYIKK